MQIQPHTAFRTWLAFMIGNKIVRPMLYSEESGVFGERERNTYVDDTGIAMESVLDQR